MAERDAESPARLQMKACLDRLDALKRSNALCEAAFDQAPVMQLVVDEERRIVRANRAAVEHLGLPAKDLMGLRFGTAFRCQHAPCPGRGSDASEACRGCLIRKMVVDTVEALEPRKDVHVDQVRVIGRRQNRSHFLVSSVPLETELGNLALLCIQDLTERRRIEEQQLKAQELQALGTLAGGIAHDFNNLLTVILGNLHLVKINVSPDDEELLARIHAIEEASLRATDLSSQLLTFGSGGAPLKQTIRLGEILEQATDTSLRNHPLDRRVELPDEVVGVDADPGQLGQAFRAVLTNAVEALGGKGRVHVRLETVELADADVPPLGAGLYARVTVEDDGPGIPPELLDTVIDPYVSTRDGHHGLGLTTAYSILRRHDGALSVESAPGHGTTVKFFLPMNAEGKPGEQAAPTVIPRPGKAKEPLPTPPPETKEDAGSPRGRVLLMDDEAGLREATTEMLGFLGWEVEAAADGVEALAIYAKALEEKRPFDAVILDLMVPRGMGGRETMKRLLQMDPSCRAIVSSGYSNDPIVSEFWEYGFSGVLPKPYGLHQLEEAVKALSG